MAERIVSPGVFTQERDLSFLEQGVGEIAGAFIGPTAKGPAFIPTVVTSQQDFENKFGAPDGKSFLGLTVKNYLRESGRATVVRVLGLDGYSNTSHTPAIIKATGTSGSFVYAVIHPTVSGSDLTAVSASGTSTNFAVTVTSSNGSFTGTGLTSTTAAGGYIGNFFGFGTTGTKGGYIYSIFPEAIVSGGASVVMSAELSADLLFLTGSTYGPYSFATTPWIQSQTLGGVNQNLFKVHTLSDGTSANKQVKISVLGPKKAIVSGTYGTFSLQVRDFTDTDANPSVLEQYDNLTLDPSDANFIARRIGNSAPVTDPNTGERYFQGDFQNNSAYVRVEMADGSENISPDALPFGFAALKSPIGYSGSAVPVPTYISSNWVSGSSRGYSTTATYNSNACYGFEFSDIPTTNMSYLAPLPSGSITRGSDFNLENLASNELYDANGTGYTVAQYLAGAAPTLASLLKFTVPFQGGFDGDNPARLINMYDGITSTNTQGFNLSSATTAGSRAYKKALDAISNPDA